MGQVAPLTYALKQCGFSNRGRKGMDHRTFVSALVFLGKRGCWWIDLPPSFGKYKSIHARFTNWSPKRGVSGILQRCSGCKDLSLLRFVDASFVKCSIACLTGRGAGPQEVTGKTKGGFTTKVTAICDTKQRVYACRIDPGNDSDHKIAEETELPGRYRRYVGDKGFSSSKFAAESKQVDTPTA